MFARTKGRVHYNIRSIFLSTNNKSIMLHSFARKTKVLYYIMFFARKTKVSYYITFFQTLLKTFSCGLCYSDRKIILSYCEKRKVNYDVCKKNRRASILYFQRTTKVSCYKYLHFRGKSKVSYYILLREKQKYHITSRSSKLS